MAEMTPWQSPYVYADNNPMNRIDVMGLKGSSLFHSSNVIQQRCRYIVIDKDGYFLGGVDDDDYSIYISEDGDWTADIGKNGLERVGIMDKGFSSYMSDFVNSNGNFKPSGFYYTQRSLSVGVRLGLSVSQSLFSFPIIKNISKLSLNLSSWDLLSVTIRNNQLEDLKYWGKDGKATLSIGASLSIFGIEESFDIRLYDELSYVPNSTHIVISPIEDHEDSKYIFSFSQSVLVTFCLTIEMNKYYE